MNPGSEIKFNLIRDAWIPAAFLDGEARHVSLCEAFERGDKIRDLTVAPHERIALMRLLICIAQARGDEIEAADAMDRLGANAAEYLREWEASFELFGAGPRFLQARTGKTETMPASKLFLALASGNNPTLFDHAGGSERAFTPAALALALVTFQNFSPLVGRGFTGRGPCVDRNALHVLQLGATLSETVLRNCLTKGAVEGDFGRPIWEMPPTPGADENDAALRNATRTYLGRLVPLTRAIWLNENCREFVLDNGLQYPAFPARWEPTCSEKLIKKAKGAEDRILVSASLARGVWRELDSLLARGNTVGSPPLTLRRLPEDDMALWTGGMVTDFKAKIEDLTESVFAGDRAIPRGLLIDRATRDWYRGGIEAAETWSFALGKAVAAFGAALKMDDAIRSGLRADALRRFWTDAEQALPRLFDLLRAMDENHTVLDTAEHSYKPADPDAPSDWHRTLRNVAWRAYHATCPDETGRQMIARVASERYLWLSSKKKKRTEKTQPIYS